MAFLTNNSVSIRGIAACVSKTVEDNLSLPLFPNRDIARKFIAATGVERRHVASKEVCTSDLCYVAADNLINELGWERSEIDCLIFVTQTPDYILPATSCILQDRLKISKECYALDISLGCSGWVYGLSVIGSLMSSGCFKKGLLLAGDVTTKIHSPQDKSSYPLFGDAGTATAIEFEENAPQIKFHFSTDGSGFQAIMIPDGGNRNRITPSSFEYRDEGDGVVLNNLNVALNGMDVFSFGISKAPLSINNLLNKFDINKEMVDFYILHQANKFMNEKICKKLKLPEHKIPYSLKNFGNTSSASIPLTMVTELKDKLSNDKLEIIGCGFGVGLSWGSVSFSTNKICVPQLIEI